MNIGSVWKPIPESLRIGFESAKERCSIHDNRLQDHFDWNVAKVRPRDIQSILFITPSLNQRELI